jgi:hypothetical protein
VLTFYVFSVSANFEGALSQEPPKDPTRVNSASGIPFSTQAGFRRDEGVAAIEIVLVETIPDLISALRARVPRINVRKPSLSPALERLIVLSMILYAMTYCVREGMILKYNIELSAPFGFTLKLKPSTE